MDAVERIAEIERARTERIVRTACHVPRQIWKPLQLTWRRRPVRPFALGRNRAHPRPGIALHANGDAIAKGFAAAEHVIKPSLAGVDDNGSRRLGAGVIHHFTGDDAINDAEGSLKRPYLSGILRAERRTVRSTNAE